MNNIVNCEITNCRSFF